MAEIKAPYRYDVVGSFLRPKKLKEARESFSQGKISKEQLTTVENEAIDDLIAKEKKAGLKILTDGEFRRQAWHLDFMWGFDGIDHHPTKTGLPFHGEQALIDDTFLTGKVSYKGNHPFLEHFKYVLSKTDAETSCKLTIPAPAQFYAQFAMPFAQDITDQFYKDYDELLSDIASGYKAFIKDVYAAGCRNLQFDDCTWGMLVDPNAKVFYGVDDKGLAELKERFLDLNNLAIDGKPADLTINTHVCRGNYHSTYANEGAYDGVAKFLLARENVNAYFLEFDDKRSGSFEPLREVSGDKKVVLGLVTTKSPVLEDKEVVKRRIDEATKYLPLDRLCLSPQCGFASCEIGNKLTEDEQWAKVNLVKEIAEEVFG